MTLQLLICTIDEGLYRLHDSLLAPCEGVSYLVSWQYTGERPEVPVWMTERDDIRVVQLQGRGLSRNRNYALANATADIVKICDDDERWTYEYFDTILDAYRRHPEADIIHFQAIGPRKVYPPRFVTSFEMTFRRLGVADLRFDERFGLGSPCLIAGEEDVFMSDARRRGLVIYYEPYPICNTRPETTGDNIRNPLLQRTKGAMFYRTGGLVYAYYKAVRESLGWMLRIHINPLPMIRNMIWGINYIRTWQA